MKTTLKIWTLRALLVLLGLTIAHFGVTLFVLADMGTDPFNVLVQGTFRTLDGLLGWSVLTHGRVHITLCLLIVAVLLVVDRSYIRLGTVLCMLCGGPIIDGFTVVLTPLFTLVGGLWFRLLMLVVGCCILAFGMTIVIKSEAGTGPNDLVALVISDKTRRKFSVVRILTDAAFVLAGFLLGGSVGVGTLVCVGCIGPVAGVFLPVNERWIHRLLQRAER